MYIRKICKANNNEKRKALGNIRRGPSKGDKEKKRWVLMKIRTPLKHAFFSRKYENQNGKRCKNHFYGQGCKIMSTFMIRYKNSQNNTLKARKQEFKRVNNECCLVKT